jgi:hypothetical protein
MSQNNWNSPPAEGGGKDIINQFGVQPNSPKFLKNILD